MKRRKSVKSISQIKKSISLLLNINKYQKASIKILFLTTSVNIFIDNPKSVKWEGKCM